MISWSWVWAWQVAVYAYGEETGTAPSVAHRDSLDGKAGISRFIVDIETCRKACQLESDLYTCGVVERGEVDGRGVSACHSKGRDQGIGFRRSCQQAGMPGDKGAFEGLPFGGKLRCAVFVFRKGNECEVFGLHLFIGSGIDQGRIVGDAVELDEEAFLELYKGGRFLAVAPVVFGCSSLASLGSLSLLSAR